MPKGSPGPGLWRNASTLSVDHADALASEIGKLDERQRASLLDNEAELASHAAGSTPEQFRRHLKRTIQQQSDDDGIEESERQREQARIVLGTNDQQDIGSLAEPAARSEGGQQD